MFLFKWEITNTLDIYKDITIDDIEYIKHVEDSECDVKNLEF